MTRQTTAEGALPRSPAPQPHAPVPQHLVGSRAAIFHLLRNASTLEEAVRQSRPAPSVPAPAPAAPVPAPVAAPPVPTVRMRPPAPAPGPSASDTGLQEFLCSDQFEFRSPDPRDASVRNMAVTRDRRVPLQHRMSGRSLSA